MSEPVVNLAKAAELCGVSVQTIRRKRDTLAALGATPSPKGWKIPISALIAAGLMPNVTPAHGVSVDTPSDTPVTHLGSPAATPEEELVTALTDKVAALENALTEARHKLAIADAVLAEKERVITTQERALALLESPPTPHPPTKRRWWQR